MIKVIMHGCNGAMGQVISKIAKEDENVEIVAGIDLNTEMKNGYKVFNEIEQCDIDADVIIDFSVASVVEKLLDYAVKKSLPVVLCTTGLSNEQLQLVKEASNKIPVLKSANMSLGINIIMKLLKDAVKVLSPEGYDVEIVEKHHNLKVDSPSGTALALADCMNEEMDNSFEYIYDRSQKREKRAKNEIGISSIRGGSIVGEHDVIFAGIDEVITISHTAYSKAIFAKGAVAGAKFLPGKQPGFYDMSDVID